VKGYGKDQYQGASQLAFWAGATCLVARSFDTAAQKTSIEKPAMFFDHTITRSHAATREGNSQ
jgi:hypothetical protein